MLRLFCQIKEAALPGRSLRVGVRRQGCHRLLIGGVAPGVLAWLALRLTLSAQAPSPSADALLQLMLSQPPVDITSPVSARTGFEPPEVRVGDKAIYRVVLNALEASVRWPEQIPAPPNLELTLSARGQITPAISNVYRPMTALNFHVRATRPGFYTMPAFMVEVYGQPVLVPEARLEVLPAQSAALPPPRQLLLETGRTNVFVGEAFSVRVLSPGNAANVVQGLQQVQFNGDGWLVDKGTPRQTIQSLFLQGRETATFIYETRVTPMVVGQLKLSAQAFSAGAGFTGPLVIQGRATLPGGVPEFVLLDSDPLTLNVQPLPPAPPHAGFTGFIGRMIVDAPQLNTNWVRVGDPIQLRVRFRGAGGALRLTPPAPPQIPGWQILPATPAEPTAEQPPLPGTLVFQYTMIPLSDDIRETPAIPFSVFDPEPAAYVDLTIPSRKLKVVAEGLPTDWSVPLQRTARAGREASPPTLSALAETPGKTMDSLVPLQMRTWFPAVQLAPVAAFLALWSYDRRRRYLEAHPDLVRRRQARRALRRERRRLARAARAGDDAAFGRSAINALQIAAAPHYPAHPRALVCHDVLALLPAPEQEGRPGELVRQLFTRDNATQFALQPAANGSLLGLREELDRLLQKMEARL